eukprot:m.46588 g.46588  ORF g.46588 m.46588 type:complete len:125 (+) comp15169_c0_seq3:234-608(+)
MFTEYRAGAVIRCCVACVPQFSYRRRFFEVLGIVGTNYMIAFFVSDVSIVLGIAGALGSTVISFILPAIFYIAIHPSPLKSVNKILAICLLCLGVVFAVVSTVVTLLDAVDGSDEPSAADLCEN